MADIIWSRNISSQHRGVRGFSPPSFSIFLQYAYPNIKLGKLWYFPEITYDPSKSSKVCLKDSPKKLRSFAASALGSPNSSKFKGGQETFPGIYILHLTELWCHQNSPWHDVLTYLVLWSQELQRSTETEAFWKGNSNLLWNTRLTTYIDLSLRFGAKVAFPFSKPVSILSLQRARQRGLYLPIICALSQLRAGRLRMMMHPHHTAMAELQELLQGQVATTRPLPRRK